MIVLCKHCVGNADGQCIIERGIWKWNHYQRMRRLLCMVVPILHDEQNGASRLLVVPCAKKHPQLDNLTIRLIYIALCSLFFSFQRFCCLVMICNTLFCIHCALFTHRDAGEKKRQYSLQFSMEKVRRCGSSHPQHGSIFKQTTGTIMRVGVFHRINTRLVMEILLNLISSPLKLITISYMRYSLPRIVSPYHLLTACLLIVY